MRNDDAYFFLEEIFTSDWATGEGSGLRGTDRKTPLAAPAVSLTAGVVASKAAHAVAPPPGSPLTRGEHPRIFVTRGELPGLRDRLASHYAKELQEFIDLLAAPSLSRQQRNVENPWGAFNYALVAVLEPDELRRRGFRFGEAIDTSQELCQRSWTYAQRLLPAIAAGEGQSHSAIATDSRIHCIFRSSRRTTGAPRTGPKPNGNSWSTPSSAVGPRIGAAKIR